ncbi:MAG: hypothetical protein LW600_04920 [Ilumatobacteraceae bacterium]|jgi:hypothetical protein|nr:hypothetical protein [Ilumatobacteraceae bacterium]
MSRRIEIELTSKREDGTWTWRAAGAQQPKGVVEDSVVPSGAQVKDVVRAEVETDLDGTRVLSIAAPKQKAERSGMLQLLPSEKPFEPVTQQLRKKGGRDGDKRRGPRREGGEGRPRGERRDGDKRREGGEGRSERPRRPFFEAPPELPQRPKPKRIKPKRVNVDAVLAELPEAQRAIAEKVLNGGVPAVRAAIEEQNKKAVAEGREKVPAEGLLQIAENLLPRLRVAEWRDRALSAETIIEDVDLRDLRSIVVTADQLVAIDEPTRALVAKMKQALVVRQETEIRHWLEDIEAATKVGRVVRALRLSSQPPKAGVPFPAALAVQLVDATVLGLTVDAPAERWITLLEAAAFSPVHAKVLPPAIPPVVSDDLLKTIVRLGPLMPQLAALFGVAVDPKARAPRPLQQPRPDKNGKKRAADVNKAAESKPARAPKPAPVAAEKPSEAPVEAAVASEAPAQETAEATAGE